MLSGIPVELQEDILDYLNGSTILRCRLLNSEWKEIVDNYWLSKKIRAISPIVNLQTVTNFLEFISTQIQPELFTKFKITLCNIPTSILSQFVTNFGQSVTEYNLIGCKKDDGFCDCVAKIEILLVQSNQLQKLSIQGVLFPTLAHSSFKLQNLRILNLQFNTIASKIGAPIHEDFYFKLIKASPNLKVLNIGFDAFALRTMSGDIDFYKNGIGRILNGIKYQNLHIQLTLNKFYACDWLSEELSKHAFANVVFAANFLNRTDIPHDVFLPTHADRITTFELDLDTPYETAHNGPLEIPFLRNLKTLTLRNSIHKTSAAYSAKISPILSSQFPTLKNLNLHGYFDNEILQRDAVFNNIKKLGFHSCKEMGMDDWVSKCPNVKIIELSGSGISTYKLSKFINVVELSLDLDFYFDADIWKILTGLEINPYKEIADEEIVELKQNEVIPFLLGMKSLKRLEIVSGSEMASKALVWLSEFKNMKKLQEIKMNILIYETRERMFVKQKEDLHFYKLFLEQHHGVIIMDIKRLKTASVPNKYLTQLLNL